MKKILASLTIICVSFLAFSQQDPQFSQNMYNRLFPNPAVAGTNGAICGTLLGRQQWVGFEGHPNTYLLSIHAPITEFMPIAPPIGVGLSVSQDALGQESTLGLKLALSYFTDRLGPGKLSGGIAIGMMNKTLKNDWIAIDGVEQDASIPDAGAKDMIVDFDFGLYYKTDRLYVGLSSLHLNGATFETVADNSSTGGINDVFNYTEVKHYYIMAGYSYEINPDLTLEPSVFIKSDAVSTQLDVNAIVVWKKQFWGGVSWRMTDAIVPMVGYSYYGLGTNPLRIGYSYDVTTSKIRGYSNGSHEIMLNYCFNIPPKTSQGKHKTVRHM